MFRIITKPVVMNVVIFIGLLVLGACGGSGTVATPIAENGEPDPTSATTSDESPSEGASDSTSLTIAFLSTVQDTMDLHQSTSSHSAFLAGHALDTLIRKDPSDGSYHSALATSWEIGEDEKSITFELRDDVTFHDGTPFNAEVVKFNLDRIVTLPEARGKTAHGWIGSYYDSTEVLDEFTAKVNFKEPYALTVDVFTTYQVGGMHSPTAVEQYGDQYGTDYLVGTGPFKFVEWTGPLGEITFERNEDYNWASEIYEHQGPAHLASFTVRGIAEPGTRSSALESQAVHISFLQEKDVGHFEELPGFETMVIPKQGTTRGLIFNLENPILQDLRVRQAISHAIDREALVASPRYSGIGEVSLIPLAAATWGQSTEQFSEYNYLYDLDQANTLLDEAGWRDEDGDGVREAHGVEGVDDGTLLHLLQLVNANVIEDSELLQGMLSDVGIELELQVHDYATKWGLVREGEYDTTFWSTSGSHFYLIEPIFHSREIEDGNNYTGYSNPEIDELFDQASTTLDPQKQRELFTQAQQIILQDAPIIPVVDWMYPWAMVEGVEGLTVDAAGIGLYLYDANLAE